MAVQPDPEELAAERAARAASKRAVADYLGLDPGVFVDSYRRPVCDDSCTTDCGFCKGYGPDSPPWAGLASTDRASRDAWVRGEYDAWHEKAHGIRSLLVWMVGTAVVVWALVWAAATFG